MVHSLSQPHATAPPLHDEPEVGQPSACPMCHTGTSITQRALAAGGAWRCVRCGQHWDAARLAAVARYAVWLDARDRADSRGTRMEG